MAGLRGFVLVCLAWLAIAFVVAAFVRPTERACPAGSVCRSFIVDMKAAVRIAKRCPRASEDDIVNSIDSQEVNEGPAAADQIDDLVFGALLFIDCKPKVTSP
ncbi:MAG TPA: hypothetical protein VIH40_13755 [Xanthobacteraceae bacterium]